MGWLDELGRRLLMLTRRQQFDRDLEEEMRLHRDLRKQEQIGAGTSAEEAHFAASRRFGNVTVLREESREMWEWNWLEHFTQDLRYGVRTMLRSPGLTIVAVLSLALGIGANTAIFSLMDAVMLRALPVEEPGQLVLFGDGRAAGSTDDFPDSTTRLFSYAFYREVQKENQVFAGVAAILSIPFGTHGTVEGSGSIEQMNTELVSGTYFPVLGVNPVLGRTLTDADDQTPGGHPVVVASYSWWRRRFGRDPSILGKKLTIGSTVYTIIGVTPSDFFGTTVGQSPDLWIPLSMEKQVSPGWNGLDNKFFQSLYIIARLKNGMGVEQAGANINVLFKQILHEYAGPEASKERLDDIQRARIDLTSVARGLSRLRRQFSEPLEILMTVVGLVLLIACANIANLLLARSTTRHREIAVRQALGARRSRLIRQLLTESLLLALLGGALGVAFAAWANHLLLAMVSGGPAPLPLNVAIDARLLVFTLVVSLVTALLFGTAPALRATSLELANSLKEGRGPVGAAARSPLAKALVVSQVAFSLVLLVGAGLFLRSLVNLTNVDTGFNKENVLRLQIDATSVGYKEDARLAALYQDIEQRVSALPGVRAASISFFTFNDGEWTDDVSVQGHASPVRDREVSHNLVGSGYFAAMGIPVLVGRTFGSQDTAASAKVAVINEAMARRLFPAGSPIGHHFGIGGPEHANDIEVIGVVKDAKYDSLKEDPQPADYLPYSQNIHYLGDFEARFSGNPKTIASEVRRAIGEVDHNLPVSDVTTLAEQVGRSIASQKLVAQLSAFFGLLAVFLACIGIYGLMAYAVTRRTSEIGIRMALGAGRSNVLWLVMREILVLVALGIAVGVPVTFAGNRLVSSLLFGLSPTDPTTMLAAPAILLAVAALAGYLPARRASKVDPMVALRYE
jgi:predicted permease